MLAAEDTPLPLALLVPLGKYRGYELKAMAGAAVHIFFQGDEITVAADEASARAEIDGWHYAR